MVSLIPFHFFFLFSMLLGRVVVGFDSAAPNWRCPAVIRHHVDALSFSFFSAMADREPPVLTDPRSRLLLIRSPKMS